MKTERIHTEQDQKKEEKKGSETDGDDRLITDSWIPGWERAAALLPCVARGAE